MRRNRAGIEHLKEVALFSACTRKELELIDSATTELRFPAGETLARQGANGHEFMVIVEGTARVEIGDGHTIATIGAGDFFGEIALLDGGPRTATVVAVTDVVAEVIGQREFSSLVEDTPHLAKKLLIGLARRLRAADVQLAG
jgi:CRP/FNR family transcriptional regulator, cyclic AMP receptor protein